MLVPSLTTAPAATMTFDMYVIHDDGPHTDQHIIFNGTAVHDRPVADGYIVSDSNRCFFIGTVNDRPVLYIYFVARFNVMYIAKYDSGIPRNRRPLLRLLPQWHSLPGRYCFRT